MTEEQYIALIIVEIGGDTESGLLAANLPIYWALHEDIADPIARMLATKIDGINLLLGQAAHQVSFRALDGASVELSDIFDHLLKLRELCLAQSSGAAAGAGGIAIGQLTTTAPIMRDRAGQPDPNDRRYRGDPLRRP